MAAPSVKTVALIGNPNTGKTTLFNALTGLSQRVGNYPGVTVEKKTGKLEDGIEVIDLPGTYSLAARSPDEMVAVNVLLGSQEGAVRPDAVVVIADAGNLQRNLYLTTQVMELGLPVIIALNMMDAAEKQGVSIDVPGLSKLLGVPVVPTVASKSVGLDELKQSIRLAVHAPTPAVPPLQWTWPAAVTAQVNALASEVPDIHRVLLTRGIIDEGGDTERALVRIKGAAFLSKLQSARKAAAESAPALPAQEAQMRYGWLSKALPPVVKRSPRKESGSDKMDAVLTHRLLGSILFVALMTLVFCTIFIFAKPLMDFISSTFDGLATLVSKRFEGGPSEGGALESLLTDGVIKGVGGVLVFLPQIIFLFLFVAILEDCGYMARAAFLMDRVLRFCGLSGHSFIPLMSSFACAVPGIMSTRTIANPRDRIATIMIAPLMSCSARIPVYAILCEAFVPDTKILGFLPLPGLVFAGMYFVGIFTAIPVAWILKKTLLKGPTPVFVMELPPYKMPGFKTVLLRVYEAAKAFTLRAGTIILAISIVIWALCYYPHPTEIKERIEKEKAVLQAQLDKLPPAPKEDEKKDEKKDAPAPEVKKAEVKKEEPAQGDKKPDGEAKADAKADEKSDPRKELQDKIDELDKHEKGEYLRQSAMGRMGQAIEPLVKPLGWDWKIGMAALASFPAREVIVATLGIIYDLGDEEEEGNKALKEQLKAATWPDGKPIFNFAVALSIMVFFALCCQCGATVATIKRETGSWGWALFAFSYMTILAYVGALVVYQVAIRLI